jgi:3-deoxy-D-manno-octulosonic-acid transferase
LFQINKQKIPSTLFSATLSKKKPSIFKFYWSWLYNLLDVIFCVNQNDKNNFLDSGAITVNISGDTRYDQVFSRLSNPKPIKINLFKTIESEVPTFICGSTWSEDEKVIFSAASELIRKKELNVIVAPHEPDSVHLKELISLLNKFKLKFCFYSSSESWPPGEVLIIDQVGILAELYQHSQMALIGGSFKKSVHSVMEALATGNITFVGPFHQNNREALDFSLIPVDDNLRMVQLIQNSSELEKYLNYTLSNKTMFSSKTKIISEVTSRTGASEVILDWIENRTLKN